MTDTKPNPREQFRYHMRKLIGRPLKTRPLPNKKEMREGIMQYADSPLMACELIKEFKLYEDT